MQAVLLAAKGTGARLIGPSSNVTDEAGNVHFNLMFDQGASGRYMLLFGSSATFAFGGVADVVDALLFCRTWAKFEQRLGAALGGTTQELPN